MPVPETLFAAVADAGPLIHLDELGALRFLSGFKLVLIPSVVTAEVVRHRPEWRGSAPACIRERDPGPQTLRALVEEGLTNGLELAKQGRPMHEVQKLMGHSTVTATEKWYAHHQPEWLMGATDGLSGTGASTIGPKPDTIRSFDSRLPIDLPISGDLPKSETGLSPLESTNAGVAESVDAGDLKSPGAQARAGSSPALGTFGIKELRCSA